MALSLFQMVQGMEPNINPLHVYKFEWKGVPGIFVIINEQDRRTLMGPDLLELEAIPAISYSPVNEVNKGTTHEIKKLAEEIGK